tara:strand:- start:173 stop:496 length:324 start_codon:yes stop_codon:yes gene_type:complete
MGLQEIKLHHILNFLFVVSIGLNVYFGSQTYFKARQLNEYRETIKHIDRQKKEAESQIKELNLKVDELNSIENDVKNFYDSIAVTVDTDIAVQDSILSAILKRHNLY